MARKDRLIAKCGQAKTSCFLKGIYKVLALNKDEQVFPSFLAEPI